MPSDQRLDQATAALRGRREAFQSSLGATLDQIDHFLAEHEDGAHDQGQARIASELGPFGAGRIDVQRFGELFRSATIDGRVRETMHRARATLKELDRLGAALYQVDVAPGADLGVAVGEALARVGRAFGAARVFDLARTGVDHDARHPLALGSFPFEHWTRRERALTPPLVVTVEGADLAAGGLARYLDGATHFVLIVRGPAPPAPLARLITPGVFVLQTRDGTGLEAHAAFDGPAVAAWMPDPAADFLHDPRIGGGLHTRLAIRRLPEEPPHHAIGGISVFQQTEELAHLEALHYAAPAETAPAGAPAAASGPGVTADADPADKLAAWLLSQTDLEGVA